MVRRGTEAPRERIGGGSIKAFRTGAGEKNRLSVVAVGQRGWIFVNGEFIFSFNLSARTDAWDVAVMTGAFKDSEVSGKSTGFKDFEGTRLTRRHGPASGSLQGTRSIEDAYLIGMPVRDFVAEARFISSQRNAWYYGFSFGEQRLGGTRHSVSVVNHAQGARWMQSIGRGYTILLDEGGSGYLSAVGAQSTSRNHMLLIALADRGWLFVNNQFVANLDLSKGQQPGPIGAIGAPLEGHRGTIRFEDFNVWAP